MRIPQSEKPTREALRKQIAALAQVYTPEWRLDPQNPDFGYLIAELFTDMTMESIERMDSRMLLYYAELLTMLGAKQAPPIPASGQIHVKMSTGSGGGLIPRGTLLYAAAPNEEGRVYFETTGTIFAADSTLHAIWCTDAQQDQIACVFANPDDNLFTPFYIFDTTQTQNLQQHVFYLQHDRVFAGSQHSDLTLEFSNHQSAKGEQQLLTSLADTAHSCWQYFNGEQWENIPTVQIYGTALRLQFDDATQETQICGHTGLFVRCVRNTPQTLELTGVRVGAQARDIKPDIMLCAGNEQPEANLYPFGNRPSVFTDFCIGSQEVLSKAGAQVDLMIELSFERIENINHAAPVVKYKTLMHRSAFEQPDPPEITVDRVAWEYWNGTGWARLFPNNTGEDFFLPREHDDGKRILSFCCPADAAPVSLGARVTYYIRANLVQMNQAYAPFGIYIVPKIHTMRLEYSYVGNLCDCTQIFVESDMEQHIFSMADKMVKTLVRPTLCKEPAMYFSFTKPIDQGPLRLFLSIKPGRIDNSPSLQWEYFGKNKQGAEQWLPLTTIDMTENLLHSGVLTFTGDRNFARLSLFGYTGFFIRVRNLDNKWAQGQHAHPMIENMEFNTIGIVQKEKHPPAYFHIAQERIGQILHLPQGGIIHTSVEVDELEQLSPEKQQLLQQQKQAQPQYDASGQLSAFWVKWEEITDLRRAQANARVYEVDAAEGIIRFGGGEHGRCPAARQQESVRVIYETASGKLGNVPVDGIQGFATAIPSIARIQNSQPAALGTDFETVPQAARRYAAKLAGMNRMVTLSDFEQQICTENRAVCQVRCVPHKTRTGAKAEGQLAVAVLPFDGTQGRFTQLEQQIRKFIQESASLTLLQCDVFEVFYIALSIHAKIEIEDYDQYHEVQKRIEERLKVFLDPIYGNFAGQGWKIGTVPSHAALYEFIKLTTGVARVIQLQIFAHRMTIQGKQEIDFDHLQDSPFAVPIYDTPQIEIIAEK